MSTGLVDQIFDYLGNDASLVSGGQGYCKLPNGTLIQWGTVTVAKNSYTGNWQCPIAFHSKGELGVVLTPLQSVTAYNANYSSSTTTAINVGRTPNTADSSFYIIAIGRWK